MYNILCVDDTEANLFVLESLFETKMDEYNLILVNSGIQALESLLTEQIDLILLDVMMPELNGFETAQLIQSNKKTQKIPIIFLTAKKDKETIHNAFKYGVDYLSKPFDEDEKFKVLNVAYTGPGNLINSSFLNNLKCPEESILKTIEYLEENNLGKKQVNFRLKDWGVSRQR